MFQTLQLSLILLLVSTIAPARDSATSDLAGTGVFEFATVAVFKEYKKQSLPVVSADRRGIFVKTDKNPKRLKYSSKGLTFKPTQARSRVFVRATNISFAPENFAAERRQDTVGGALEAIASEAQDYSDRVNSASEARRAVMLGPGESVESVSSDSVDARAAAENMDTFSAHSTPTSQFADNIFFAFTLTPNQNLENVSAAVVLRHDVVDKSGKPTGRKSTLLSVEKIGNLEVGKANKAKFSVSFREQFLSGLSVRVYLFDGDMTPVASDLAGPIRELPFSRL